MEIVAHTHSETRTMANEQNDTEVRENVSVRDRVAYVWRRFLMGTPTVFGRLALLAGLRDGEDWQYRHCGLDLLLEPDETDSVIRESHECVFRDWMAMDRDSQAEDLKRYLQGTEGDPSMLRSACTDLGTHLKLIPPSVPEEIRAAYLTSFDELLDSLPSVYELCREPDPGTAFRIRELALCQAGALATC